MNGIEKDLFLSNSCSSNVFKTQAEGEAEKVEQIYRLSSISPLLWRVVSVSLTLTRHLLTRLRSKQRSASLYLHYGGFIQEEIVLKRDIL